MLFRSTYKVVQDPVTVVFKAIICKKGDNEKIRQVKDEFMLSIKAHKAAADGVVTPISISETDDKFLPHHIIEFVYEYGGENLLTALKDVDGHEIVEVMNSVVRIMAKLELKQIYHSDIKPENIVICCISCLSTTHRHTKGHCTTEHCNRRAASKN